MKHFRIYSRRIKGQRQGKGIWESLRQVADTEREKGEGHLAQKGQTRNIPSTAFKEME